MSKRVADTTSQKGSASQKSNPKDQSPPPSSKNLDNKPKSQKDLDTSVHETVEDEKTKRAKEETAALKAFEEQINKMLELPKEPVPEEPDALMEFSVKRTAQLEGVIETMKSFMIKEEARHLEQRNQLLNLQDDIKDIQAKEKLSLEEKVKEGMRSQLEEVAKQLLKLEAERDKYKSKLVEYDYLLAEHDGLVRHYNAEENKNLAEIEIQKQMIENFKKVIAELQKQMALKDGEILEKDDNIKKLKQEVEEMRGVLFKLNDVRLVLNRVMEPYSSSPDEMIMQMKNGTEFSTKKPVGRVASGTGGVNNGGTAGLLLGPKKAIDFTTANDDDFWYGDKKDKRFDLPPMPDKLRNDIMSNGDNFRTSQSGLRRPLPPNQTTLAAGGRSQNGVYVTNPSNSQLDVDQNGVKTIRPVRKG